MQYGGWQGELLGKWVQKELKAAMQIVKINETSKWIVLPNRWIVERTFASLMNFRKIVMDYERTIEPVESHIYTSL